jgi:hypothetical protein
VDKTKSQTLLDKHGKRLLQMRCCSEIAQNPPQIYQNKVSFISAIRLHSIVDA